MRSLERLWVLQTTQEGVSFKACPITLSLALIWTRVSKTTLWRKVLLPSCVGFEWQHFGSREDPPVPQPPLPHPKAEGAACAGHCPMRRAHYHYHFKALYNHSR